MDRMDDTITKLQHLMEVVDDKEGALQLAVDLIEDLDMTIQELTDERAELRDMNEELHYSLQDREW